MEQIVSNHPVQASGEGNNKKRPREIIWTCTNCETTTSALMEVTSSENTDSKQKGKGIKYNNVDSKEPSLGVSSWGPNRFDKGVKLVKPVGNSVGIMELEGDECSKSCLSHSSISVTGRQRAMKDAMTVVPGIVDCGGCGGYDFFGVYDGHGGAKVATCCRDKMHNMLAAAVESNERGVEGSKRGLKYWDEVMKVCFEKMDMEVLNVVERDSEMKSMGSTASVVLVSEEEIVVANCGDSRVVLCRGGSANPLSQDHKPHRNDERERVEAAGQILDGNGSRIIGVLAVSRSIGDYYLKPYVISEPEVTVSDRAESDEFLIIATDGLWDVVSNEMACEVGSKCLAGQLERRSTGESNESRSAEAAAMLVELALARGSKDNISVIVVELTKLNTKQN